LVEISIYKQKAHHFGLDNNSSNIANTIFSRYNSNNGANKFTFSGKKPFENKANSSEDNPLMFKNKAQKSNRKAKI